jgi:hypothetical protein
MYILYHLTLYLLTWNIGWSLNNASKWQMWFNSAFKGLIYMYYFQHGNLMFFGTCFLVDTFSVIVHILPLLSVILYLFLSILPVCSKCYNVQITKDAVIRRFAIALLLQVKLYSGKIMILLMRNRGFPLLSGLSYLHYISCPQNTGILYFLSFSPK